MTKVIEEAIYIYIYIYIYIRANTSANVMRTVRLTVCTT